MRHFSVILILAFVAWAQAEGMYNCTYYNKIPTIVKGFIEQLQITLKKY